jgi:hypothetical protein
MCTRPVSCHLEFRLSCTSWMLVRHRRVARPGNRPSQLPGKILPEFASAQFSLSGGKACIVGRCIIPEPSHGSNAPEEYHQKTQYQIADSVCDLCHGSWANQAQVIPWPMRSDAIPQMLIPRLLILPDSRMLRRPSSASFIS